MENKPKKSFSSLIDKASEVGEKAAEGIQRGAKSISEQTKQTLLEQKMKRYNPLFADEFKSADFKIPNVIEIVDDAIRRGIDVCEGAIGWTDTVAGVEILHLYDEFVNESNIHFVPVAKCDAVYCVDPFDRTKFNNTDSIFERATNEKLAELEHIAYALGARSCSIEIAEMDSLRTHSNVSVSAINGVRNSAVNSNGGHSQHGKNTTYFEGARIAQVPTLKWFAHDDNINGLIAMRCSGSNSIKSKVLEIKCSSFATMSQKVACAIDKLLKTKASISMEKQAIKEHTSKLVFEIDF